MHKLSKEGPESLKTGPEVVGSSVDYLKKGEVWVVSNLRFLQMLQPALSSSQVCSILS